MTTETTNLAAQASDEPMRAAFEQWHLKHIGAWMPRMQGDQSLYRFMDTQNAWEAWKASAALKAQPAPTEAQGEVDWPSIVKEKDRQIVEAGKTMNELRCKLAAQGEDSARLDFISLHGADSGDYGDTDWYVAGETYHDMTLRQAIDVAMSRAAPQPQEQS